MKVLDLRQLVKTAKKSQKEEPETKDDPDEEFDDDDDDSLYQPTVPRSAVARFSPTTEIMHVFASMYGWDFETYYDKTPIWLIEELSKKIADGVNHGWLGYQEIQFYKAYARAKGYSKF